MKAWEIFNPLDERAAEIEQWIEEDLFSSSQNHLIESTSEDSRTKFVKKYDSRTAENSSLVAGQNYYPMQLLFLFGGTQAVFICSPDTYEFVRMQMINGSDTMIFKRPDNTFAPYPLVSNLRRMSFVFDTEKERDHFMLNAQIELTGWNFRKEEH